MTVRYIHRSEALGQILRRLNDMYERNDLSSFAFVAIPVDNEGDILNGHVGASYELLGALEVTKINITSVLQATEQDVEER